jgi:hypothetical protein
VGGPDETRFGRHGTRTRRGGRRRSGDASGTRHPATGRRPTGTRRHHTRRHHTRRHHTRRHHTRRHHTRRHHTRRGDSAADRLPRKDLRRDAAGLVLTGYDVTAHWWCGSGSTTGRVPRRRGDTGRRYSARYPAGRHSTRGYTSGGKLMRWAAAHRVRRNLAALS